MPPHILVVTSKIDVTADLIVWELTKRGVSVTRFNVEDFQGRLFLLQG